MDRQIIMELENKGYHAEMQEVIKNGVTCHGVTIKTEPKDSSRYHVAPIMYIDDMVKAGLSAKTIAENIIETYERTKDTRFDFLSADGLNRNAVLDHLMVGLQRLSHEDIVKRPVSWMPGVEEYLYIRLTESDAGTCSMKFTPSIASMTCISLQEAWDLAYSHMQSETVVESLSSVLSGMMGTDESLFEDSFPLYVISNKNKWRGASAVLNTEAMNNFARKHHCKTITVLPSSIHEALLIPDTGDDDSFSAAMLSQMVNDINCSTVDPVDQLADRAFQFVCC